MTYLSRLDQGGFSVHEYNGGSANNESDREAGKEDSNTLNRGGKVVGVLIGNLRLRLSSRAIEEEELSTYFILPGASYHIAFAIDESILVAVH